MTDEYIRRCVQLENVTHFGRPVRVSRVEILPHNAILVEAYETKKRTLAFPQERILFHGTLPENVASLLERGFKFSSATMSGFFGRGFYLSNKVGVCIPYSLQGYQTGEETRLCLVVFKVLLGNSAHIVRGSWSMDCRAGADSHWNGSDYCIFEPAQALPVALLHLECDPRETP